MLFGDFPVGKIFPLWVSILIFTLPIFLEFLGLRGPYQISDQFIFKKKYMCKISFFNKFKFSMTNLNTYLHNRIDMDTFFCNLNLLFHTVSTCQVAKNSLLGVIAIHNYITILGQLCFWTKMLIKVYCIYNKIDFNFIVSFSFGGYRCCTAIAATCHTTRYLGGWTTNKYKKCYFSSG